MPDHPPLGRAAGARYPAAVDAAGAGVRTRHQPQYARSCVLAWCAVGAARGRPGRWRLLSGCGASWVGRSPTPARSSLGRVAGAWYPLVVGVGGVGVGTRHQPHSARSYVLAWRAVGEVSLAWVSGVLGWAVTQV